MVAILFALIASTLPASAHAGGYTNAAVPTRIDVSPVGGGFMIFGAFGNAGGCTANGDTIWVQDTHPQYKLLYATVLAAMTSGQKYLPMHTLAV